MAVLLTSTGSMRRFSELHVDRTIRLATLGLLCVVAAMVWSICARQAAATGTRLMWTPVVDPVPPAQLEKAVQAAADARMRKGKLGSLMQHMPPVDVHFALVNVSREPFIYGSILQDEDSYQVRNPNISALEPGLTALWVHHAAQCCAGGGAVVDVGSHFGYYSLLGASMGCTFVAVEPVPRYRAILESNVRLNGLEAAGTVLPYAVGFEDKAITMDVPAKGNFGLARVLDDGVSGNANYTKLQIPQRRLDDMLAEAAVPADVCLLKVDVEGREPSVVLSAPRFFSTSRVRHVMLEFSPGFGVKRLADMLSFLHDKGYTAWEVDWARAKIGQPVGSIDPASILGRPVSIASAGARGALVAAIKPRFNTNLWLSLADA